MNCFKEITNLFFLDPKLKAMMSFIGQAHILKKKHLRFFTLSSQDRISIKILLLKSLI